MEMDSTFKPALLLMAGRVMAFAVTFFIPVVLVRVFDQTEFGTYKQLFLIYATLFGVAQIGMAESLFYFLPSEREKGGRYAANSIIALTIAGLVCLGLLSLGAPRIAQLLGNSALIPYIPYVGFFLLLTMVSSILEIVMTSRKRFFLTASAYALSDMLKGLCFIIPAVLTRRLEWLLLGAIFFASIRLIATLFYIGREFRGDTSFNAPALKSQLAYALPFAASELLTYSAGQYHNYAVSYSFDAATFAIYAVGCLQIPLVELVHGPVSNVMMVRMTEEIRDGRGGSVLPIWNDTARKMALVFFPLLGLLLVSARELIVLLFTENYLASVPIFMIWSVTVLLPVLQTDGALRVYAKTRFLFWVRAAELVLTVALIHWFIPWFHLAGAAMVTVFAAFATKLWSLVRLKQVMQAGLSEFLPWRSLALNAAVSVAAAAPAMLVKTHLELPPFLLMFVACAAYGIAWLILAFALRLITVDERIALIGLLQRFPTSASKVGQLIRGY
jgi:O-antigen/teichoic acid export membrane protein